MLCNIYIYTWGLLTDLSDLFLAQDHDRTVNGVRQLVVTVSVV